MITGDSQVLGPFSFDFVDKDFLSPIYFENILWFIPFTEVIVEVKMHNRRTFADDSFMFLT